MVRLKQPSTRSVGRNQPEVCDVVATIDHNFLFALPKMDERAAGRGTYGGNGKPGKSGKPAPAAPTNFVRNQIAADLARGTYEPRQWAGKPGVDAERSFKKLLDGLKKN